MKAKVIPAGTKMRSPGRYNSQPKVCIAQTKHARVVFSWETAGTPGLVPVATIAPLVVNALIAQEDQI